MKLEICNGTFTYPSSERIVLKNISFSLDSGEILAILGPNGAGKTTLLRSVMGLLKWQSGETKIDGKPLDKMSRQTLWQKVSYVPQAKSSEIAYTVEEMILLGCASMISPFAIPGQKEQEAVEQALRRTKLEKLRHRHCNQLSGGELQMVLIARAIVSHPEILILDEPESNLDFQNQLLVLNMISELSSEGILCIFNTHYPSHALRMAGKVLILSKTGDFCFGKAREVITEENILRYFGVRSVIGSVEAAGAEYPDIVPLSIEENLPENTTVSVGGIACITVLMKDRQESDALNKILHTYGDCIIGRMGLPQRDAGVNIITLMADAPYPRVMELSDQLRRLENVSVKTSFMAKEAKEG